jgi:peptidoglycan/xylan/chitin deacetylase (PgdA/CDA1 family)
MIQVIQAWDDGVCSDVRLIEVLRRHRAKATFCLNPGLYQDERSFGWLHEGREVWRLGSLELRDVYEGFEICSHSMTHPRLTDLSPDQLQWEVDGSRRALENIFQEPVLGFCYPFNDYNSAVINAVRSAGYIWARGGEHRDDIFPPAEIFAFHPNCRFDDADFMGKYQRSKETGGVFFFWGHSYELIDEPMWERFEGLIERISFDPDARWSSIADLFV